jgi:hypothetical protein
LCSSGDASVLPGKMLVLTVCIIIIVIIIIIIIISIIIIIVIIIDVFRTCCQGVLANDAGQWVLPSGGGQCCWTVELLVLASGAGQWCCPVLLSSLLASLLSSLLRDVRAHSCTCSNVLSTHHHHSSPSPPSSPSSSLSCSQDGACEVLRRRCL